jgi:hypothetical protein
VTGTQSQSDRRLALALIARARSGARRPDLTAGEEAAEVAALRDLAGGRADLLAQAAGLLEGVHEAGPDEGFATRAAQLCVKAGADTQEIPAWIAEAERRHTANARPGRAMTWCDTRTHDRSSPAG